MPPKPILMTLSPNKATEKIGWHRRTGPYDDQYVEQIVDPSGAIPKKLLTAIPSPFARMHLFDAAFNFVSTRDNGRVQHDGRSIFHQIVSDCLDVLELLFGWSTKSAAVEITALTPKDDLASLRTSKVDGQRLLAAVLDLFLSEDAETANFDLQPSFILLSVGHQVIAASSPLTFFITSPQAAAVAQSNGLINPATGKPFFAEPRPLYTRQADFQLYVHWLFCQNMSLRESFRRMYAYVSQSLDVMNRDLAVQARGLEHGGAAQLQAEYTQLTDPQNKPLQVCGAQLYQRPESAITTRISQSPLVLVPKRLPQGLDLPPLVLEEQHDSFGKYDPGLVIPDVAALPLQERVLPDLHVKYPYLVVDDFIEDKIIRLPYQLNSTRFALPQCDGFKTDESSFLLPLKPAFFDFFDKDEISSIAKLVRKGDGVSFELSLPTRSKLVTFRKTFYESPQLARFGTIVNAELNCAIFPIVVVPDRKEYSDKYWVMLVDAEIDPAWRHKDCFGLSFYVLKNEKYVVLTNDNSAPQYVHTTKRSIKSVEAGSTYFEITGGHFEFIQVEAFAFDPTRHTYALIVPKWNKHAVGTRKATVAIDFGTTNTHIAWAYDDARPLPEALTVDKRDLQLGLLSAPREDAPTESAQYDKLVARLAGTEIRLHHEFLPSIINPSSPFKFPLRTATSECPNLKPGEYRALGNINISFIFETDATRRDEVISTDLKWSVRASESVRKRVEAFIRELLVIVRTKLILNDVDPSTSRIVWFRPLSFDEYTKSRFEEFWSDGVHQILDMREDQLQSLTESEAPYYYHAKAGKTITSKPVICVDIGGGSTDVVFFDKGVPKIGTSFSFAGNALWGSGYDAVGDSQTGVVRKYGNWIKNRIGGIHNNDDRRRIDSVYNELTAARVPSEELVNFFFAIDKYVEFSKRLSEDGGVKCVVLIHYAAILFHCAQVMHALGLPAPEIVCFSGRGAQSIGILDVSPTKRQVADLTHRLFEDVYSTSIAEPVKLILAANSKEATCNGGILKDVASKLAPEFVVSMGDGKVVRGRQTTEDVTPKTLDAVVLNVNNFIDCLLRLNKAASFRERFGIAVDMDAVAIIMRQKVGECIGLGLDRHGYKAGTLEKLNETLFFYPLIQKLFEVGNEVIHGDLTPTEAK